MPGIVTDGAKKTDGRPVLLVVDDQPSDRELLIERLTPRGYAVETAADGVEALEKLERDPARYQLVLLDEKMPRLSGLELLEKLKASPGLLSRIPVILQTASGDKDQVRAGIEAGCYYYLIKPYDKGVLLSLVAAALDDFTRHEAFRAEVRKGIRALSMMQRGSFEFSTLREAGELSTLLAYAFPDPETCVIGLGELLFNAVEHGNLGISYEEKSRLLKEGTWESEVERLVQLDEHRHKKVRVELERDAHEISVSIRDEGKGFDSARFLEIDPQRAFDTHGRGIAIARIYSFSSIEYKGCGNEVVARLDLGSAVDAAGRLEESLTG
jgi:CheY-like chemotaxis protein